MKNSIVFDEYNEIDFKPTDLLKEYIRLTQQDVQKLLAETSQFQESSCPSCLQHEIQSSFVKFGLTYHECAECLSLYVSPRPSDRLLDEYYRNASARLFWREKFSKMTVQKRHEKIIKPRFQWIVDSTQEFLPNACHLLDVHTDQEIYLQEMSQYHQFEFKTLLNPCLTTDFLTTEKFQVIRKPFEKVMMKGEVDVVSLLEVCDRTADVEQLFEMIHRVLKPDGLCFMTTILSSGFDIQTLWNASDTLIPPDRLNLFSVEGLKCLFNRHGFECLEFSTPGLLDLEIVVGARNRDVSLEIPRFVSYLLDHRNDAVKKSFQKFLQENLLSSYGRVVLRKR